MPTTITGTDGVSQVQAGSIQSDDLAAGAITIGSGDLPAGSVLQVVQTSSTNRVQISSSSAFVDIDPSLSITPLSTSSKILIIASYNIGLYTPDFNVSSDIRLLRDSSSLIIFNTASDIRADDDPNTGELRMSGQYSFVYLDAPSANTEITYKFQGRCPSGSRMESVSTPGNSQNTITLMEIAG